MLLSPTRRVSPLQGSRFMRGFYLGLARVARFSPGYNLSGFQPSWDRELYSGIRVNLVTILEPALAAAIFVDDAHQNQGESCQPQEVDVRRKLVVCPQHEKGNPFQSHHTKRQRECGKKPFVR